MLEERILAEATEKTELVKTTLQYSSWRNCDREEHRNKWKLARVTKNNSDKNGLVRTATIAFGDQSLTNAGERSYTLTLADRQTDRPYRSRFS